MDNWRRMHLPFCSRACVFFLCSLVFISIILDLWSPALPAVQHRNASPRSPRFPAGLFTPAKHASCYLRHFQLKPFRVAVGSSRSPSGAVLCSAWALSEGGTSAVSPNSIALLLPHPASETWLEPSGPSEPPAAGEVYVCMWSIYQASQRLFSLISGVLFWFVRWCCFGLFVFAVTQGLCKLLTAKFVCFAVSIPLFWNAVWV